MDAGQPDAGPGDAGVDGGTDAGVQPNPVPSLRAVSPLVPASVLADGGAFQLSVFGTGFIASSTVRWNGADRVTVLADAGELRAAISAADVATAAVIAVTVFNPAPGGGGSNAADFTVENPVPLLSQTEPLFPSSVEAGGDGGFTFSVRGSNFVPTSVVRFDGDGGPTSFFKSVGELSVTLSPDDYKEGGLRSVRVFTPAPGGGLTNVPALFRIRERRGAFLRANLRPDGGQAVGHSIYPQVSETGRFIAFGSEDNQLTPDDNWFTEDVYVRDTCLGTDGGCAPTTLRVSVSPDGGDGFGFSGSPSLSPNGRFVAFVSVAANLVPGDNNSTLDVFLRDTCLGAPSGCMPQTLRASVGSTGVEGNGDSDLPAVSATGRFVAFRSDSSNLVPGDTNASPDVFVRDTCLGAGAACTPQTLRVSQSTQGVQGNIASGNDRPAISADGRYVAFSSNAWTLLATPDTNARSDIFLHDTCFGAPASCTRSTVRISDTVQNVEGSGASLAPAMSPDARFIVFSSTSSNLAAGDLNNLADIYLRDTCIGASGCTQSITRISLTPEGQEPNGGNVDPTVSADGRFIGWTSFAMNLVGTTMGGLVKDTCRNALGCVPGLIHVTVAKPGGMSPSTYWYTLALSHDGRFAVWTADQPGIVPNDTNGARDIFVSHTGF